MHEKENDHLNGRQFMFSKRNTIFAFNLFFPLRNCSNKQKNEKQTENNKKSADNLNMVDPKSVFVIVAVSNAFCALHVRCEIEHKTNRTQSTSSENNG